MSIIIYDEAEIHTLSPQKLNDYQSIIARHIVEMPESERAPYLKVIEDCKKVRAYRQRIANQKSNKQ